MWMVPLQSELLVLPVWWIVWGWMVLQHAHGPSCAFVVLDILFFMADRSDALGIFLPMFGKDWSHRGIANLFSHIDRNGYRILFLSSRSIVQAHQTRKYLSHLKQGLQLCSPLILQSICQTVFAPSCPWSSPSLLLSL